MAKFSVILVTAAPSGQAAEAGGAFVKIDGREALLRSIELFLNRDEVKQIQAVFIEEMADEAKRRHGAHLSFSGVKVVAGGVTRVKQIAAAVPTLADDITHVIVHDAARPIVPYTDLDALFAEAEKADAVTLATPAPAPLVQLDEHRRGVAVFAADQFMQLLTPQAFSRKSIEQIAATGQELPIDQITLLKGSPLNIRVAGPGDAKLAQAMLSMLPMPKKGALGAFEEAQW